MSENNKHCVVLLSNTREAFLATQTLSSQHVCSRTVFSRLQFRELSGLAAPRSDKTSALPLRRREASVLEMKWHCDVCQRENVCDVSSEMHFFAVILAAKTDHETISPSCAWDQIGRAHV